MCKRMGIAKRLLSALTAFFVILSLSANRAYAITIPMLPYIPPTDAQQMDLLFNIFGITKPAIEDDVRRLQGYWELIEFVMGASADDTKNKILKMFESARTSRVWEIDPETISALNQIGSYAVSNGVSYIQNDAETQEQLIYDKLMLWNRIQGKLTEQEWNVVASAANQKFGRGQWTACAIYSAYRSDYSISLGAYPKDYEMRRITGTIGIGNKQWSNIWVPISGNTYYPCVVFTKFNNGAWNKVSNYPWLIGTDNYFSGSGKTYDGINLGQTAGVAQVIAQNAEIGAALAVGALVPITAQTAILNGAIDDTKPARIHLPTSLPVPAENVTELPAVQEKLGVVPISDDVTETVGQLQQAVTESVGSASDYAIDLSQYFPFCLPFDIFRIIGAFIAEPEAPKFSYTIVNPWASDEEHNIEIEIDLSVFDQVAEILRTLESILFVIGLCVVTRSHYLRG